MKALTLWQPWATLIALGEKNYETRSWSTNYRGPIAIHAGQNGKGIQISQYKPKIIETLKDHGLILDFLPLGVVVCKARLIDCFPVEEIWHDLNEYEQAFGNFSAGRFAWELDLIERYDPPIPAKGERGLWEWKQ